MELLLLLGLLCTGRVAAEEIYTNSWAVQIEGGSQEASRLSHKHDFVYGGLVSTMRSRYRTFNQTKYVDRDVSEKQTLHKFSRFHEFQ